MTQGFGHMDLQFAGMRQDMVGLSSRITLYDAFHTRKGNDNMNQD